MFMKSRINCLSLFILFYFLLGFVKLLAAVLLQNAGATMERLVLREGALPTDAVDNITQVRYTTYHTMCSMY